MGGRTLFGSIALWKAAKRNGREMGKGFSVILVSRKEGGAGGRGGWAWGLGVLRWIRGCQDFLPAGQAADSEKYLFAATQLSEAVGKSVSGAPCSPPGSLRARAQLRGGEAFELRPARQGEAPALQVPVHDCTQGPKTHTKAGSTGEGP